MITHTDAADSMNFSFFIVIMTGQNEQQALQHTLIYQVMIS
jgi:hypothetical protein